jgi:aryl-alcohol dehydrogenase-like predicted oxidoreductase
MPLLLGHDDSRVRAIASQTLRDHGETAHLIEVLRILGEPRSPACESVRQLLAAIDHDRVEAVARFLLAQAAPAPDALPWALDQAGVAFPFDEEHDRLSALLNRSSHEPAAVRCALARLAARWPHADGVSRLRAFLDDPDPGVRLESVRGVAGKPDVRLDAETFRRLLSADDPSLRAEAAKLVVAQGADPTLLAALQGDPHPHVRAAALTPSLAGELVREPTRETSWHVLATAARLAKVPLWNLAPAEPWRPPPGEPAVAPPLRPQRTTTPHARPLGRDGVTVSVVGISGHYGLPVEGFVRAVEAGVNLMFWEPNYRTMTEFFGRVSPADRAAVHLVAGTFEADGERVRRDAERALRSLRVERLDLFLLFWVRSWARISPDVTEALIGLKEEGKVAAYGLSTHSRPLALEAMDAGWDPVMVRHSAAHRGAEERVFPRAAQLGVSLITFNSTCYGRLLEPRDGCTPPTAADCYRYSLAQPAVRCCLSAPATIEELDDNLAALRDPALPEERRRELVTFGDALYEEEVTFRRLIRSV